MEAAVRKVQIFADIYERFKALPSDEQVRVFLREKANAPIAEANEIASDIGKLLKKNVPHLTSTPAGGGGEKKDMDNYSNQMNPSSGSYEEYKLGGGVVVSLRKENTAKVWARAKQALDILLGVEESGKKGGKE